MPLNVIVCKITVVCTTVGPRKPALSMFFAVNVLTVILGTVRPRLDALPVLFIFLPVAFILRAIQVAVHSMTVGLVVQPHSIINISISVNKPSFSIGFVLTPPSFVHGTVRPCLLSFSSPNIGAIDPLALELGLVLEYLLRSKVDLIVVQTHHVAAVVELT